MNYPRRIVELTNLLILWLACLLNNQVSAQYIVRYASDQWQSSAQHVMHAEVHPTKDTSFVSHYVGKLVGADNDYKIFDTLQGVDFALVQTIPLHTIVQYEMNPGFLNDATFTDNSGEQYYFTFDPSTQQGGVFNFSDTLMTVASLELLEGSRQGLKGKDSEIRMVLNGNAPYGQRYWAVLSDYCTGEVDTVVEFSPVSGFEHRVVIPAAMSYTRTLRYHVVSSGNLSVTKANLLATTLAVYEADYPVIESLEGNDQNAVTLTVSNLDQAISAQVKLYRLTDEIPIETWYQINSGETQLEITNLPLGEYTLKAMQKDGDQVPSYLGNEWLFDSAQVVQLGCAETINASINLNMLAGSNGTAQISGQLFHTDHGNKTVAETVGNIDLILYTTDPLTPIKHTTTDELGAYEFLQLDTGHYYIYADIAGYSTEELVDVNLEATSAAATIKMFLDTINFTVTQTEVTGIDKHMEGNFLTLIPSRLSGQLECYVSDGSIEQAIIYDTFGRTVATWQINGSRNSEYPLHDFKSGVYIVAFKGAQYKTVATRSVIKTW